MSKNVAVFVDVANIFYAAKAAGADIDYVTLLKSAIAGRDFVRAYAYTGLDPDNENQRQFHSFLARNGYKVVSKDIRKYGDGRIKANLDIELVVDLMRMARNLDVAVVVSGDGDFAPAIRAVQQMGVRVEVISFRGNTSADLIEVADAFIDIAQIARVDKESARSGRRVAAEGDLSMTAVPEKETEGAPRRRRGRGRDVEREEAVAALPESGMVVLPGERLSRVADSAEDEVSEPVPEAQPAVALDEADVADEADDAPRRRRRRGGRGRGRGRRSETELVGVAATGTDEEDEDFETVMPPAPPHQTFGSVWDSQLGVATAPVGGPPPDAAEPGHAHEEDDEEPEIPEYLLAERRQRQQGQRGRMGRGRGAYQAALDRERFGRAAGPGTGAGFGGSRLAERPRHDRGRGGRGTQARPERSTAQRPPERASAPPRASGDPWSEVPPELEELLRAELMRKTERAPGEPAADTGGTAAETTTAAEGAAEEIPSEEPKPKRATRARSTAKRAAASAEQPADAAATSEEAKPKRATRSRAAAKSAEPAPTEPGTEEAKPKRQTRPRAAKTTGTAEARPEEGTAEAEAKPTRRRSRKDAAAES